jgi:hypothetical protein
MVGNVSWACICSRISSPVPVIFTVDHKKKMLIRISQFNFRNTLIWTNILTFVRVWHSKEELHILHSACKSDIADSIQPVFPLHVLCHRFSDYLKVTHTISLRHVTFDVVVTLQKSLSTALPLVISDKNNFIN